MHRKLRINIVKYVHTVTISIPLRIAHREGDPESKETMRIRRYPGKAVDASLSLEQSNAMETIYKNNWLNAHENIRSNGTAFGNDYHQPMGHSPVGFDSSSDVYSNGVSSLGKYQMTLEQIRQLELKNKDPSVTQAIKDLSGYKPSTLRRKNRRHYPGWDDLIETEQNVSDHLDEQANGEVYNYSQFDIKEPSEPVKNVSKSRQHKGSTKNAEDRQQRPVNGNYNGDSPTYENLASIKVEAKAQSKLKRSQTLKESSAASFCSTLDIKDIFRRCPQSKGEHCDKDLTRRNASSSSSGNSSANSSTKSSTDMTTALMVQPNRISYNCDRNSRTISIEPSYSQGRTNAMIEPENAPSRMSISYNTNSILPPAQKSKSIVRAKSVRIQNPSFTTQQWDESPIMSAPRPSKPPPSPPLRRNASSPRKESPPNNKFNTVSAAGTRQRNKNLPTSILVTTAASESVPTITTTTPVPVIKPILKHVQIVDRAERQSRQTGSQMTASVVANTATVQVRRKPASSSSVDSDEMFSIPRPRLIVPVHTYARKRRTGNLLSAQADDINDDDDEVHDSGKGELNLLIYDVCQRYLVGNSKHE